MLELRLLCRGADIQADAITQWREHLLPALAGDDVALAASLWDSLSLGTCAIKQQLRLFARQRGWTVESLRDWGAEGIASTQFHNSGKPQLRPPEAVRALWAHGALSYTPEQGLELHTAAVALLEREEDLQHRLWRGQANLLLPLIDGLRLRLCAHLTRRYGSDWPIRWDKPNSSEELEAVINTPFACQWGYLRHLLRQCSAFRLERVSLPLVERSHRMRNELSHYRPIDFIDFELFWEELGKLAP
jgi:hypothetical protein